METEDLNIMKRNHMMTRIILCIIGVAVCGISVGFFKVAAFGVDPFTSLVTGLDKAIPIEYGLIYIIINAILLIFSLIFDRRMIGLGTIINLLLLGYITQYTQMFLESILPTDSIFVRIICLIIAVLGLSFSAGLYVPADLGVSTYDAIAIVMDRKWHILKFRYDRIITDFICVLCGGILYWISGSPLSGITAVIGIGTIITAFFMGPLVDFFSNKFTRKYFLKD